jgi:RNA polymerase sigma factor (sigma-70 family)
VTEALDEAAGAPSDAALIAAVRSGDTAAYGVLYERHLCAARRAATSLAPTTAEREDLIAEAFTRILRVIRNGRGPTEEFRPYLLVTMRNAAINANRGGVEVALYGEVPDLYHAAEDPMSSRLHAEVAANAFASLPERWRTVLWHTEVEGDSPAEVAPLLGLSPNSVAALAYRAREGLRQAYLQQYLPAVEARSCRSVATQLAGWVRRGIAAPKRRRIAAHLDGCPDCRALADRLSKINSELRVVIGPAVLGAPFALTYLTSGGSAVTSGTVLATGVAQTGASTAGYLSTVKVVVAGTALVTAAAVTTVLPLPPLSAPSDPPAVSAPVTGRPGPGAPPTAGPVPDGTAGPTDTGVPDPTVTGIADPVGPDSAAPSAPMSAGGKSAAPTSPAKAAKEAKEAEKAEKKAQKAEDKAQKAEDKAARQAAEDQDPELAPEPAPEEE